MQVDFHAFEIPDDDANPTAPEDSSTIRPSREAQAKSDDLSKAHEGKDVVAEESREARQPTNALSSMRESGTATGDLVFDGSGVENGDVGQSTQTWQADGVHGSHQPPESCFKEEAGAAEAAHLPSVLSADLDDLPDKGPLPGVPCVMRR